MILLTIRLQVRFTLPKVLLLLLKKILLQLSRQLGLFHLYFLSSLILLQHELKRLHRGCASEIVTGLRLRS